MKIIDNSYQLLFPTAAIVIQVADLARQKRFICLGLYLNIKFPSSPIKTANIYALCQHCRVIKQSIV